MYTRRGCQGCVGQSALMIFNDALGEDFVLTNPNSTWFYSQYRWTAHRNANARDTIWPWEFYYELIRNEIGRASCRQREEGADGGGPLKRKHGRVGADATHRED